MQIYPKMLFMPTVYKDTEQILQGLQKWMGEKKLRYKFVQLRKGHNM